MLGSHYRAVKNVVLLEFLKHNLSLMDLVIPFRAASQVLLFLMFIALLFHIYCTVNLTLLYTLLHLATEIKVDSPYPLRGTAVLLKNERLLKVP